LVSADVVMVRVPRPPCPTTRHGPTLTHAHT
jgi:hypothetical protein